MSDFGWSRHKTLDSGKTFFHGWQWVAPEILAGSLFAESADVYSFAMVAWETLTRSLPFVGMNPVQIALAVREQQLRPPPVHASRVRSRWRRAVATSRWPTR